MFSEVIERDGLMKQNEFMPSAESPVSLEFRLRNNEVTHLKNNPQLSYPGRLISFDTTCKHNQ